MECAPDIAAEPEDRKVERMELPKDEQELTKDKERSNKDEEGAKDVDEDIERHDQNLVRLVDNGGLLESKKDDEEEIESLARRKLEQILKTRETLITNNVAEVITLEGDHEDGVSETIKLSKFIDNEKEKIKGTENVSEEKSGDKEEAREQAKDCKIIEEGMGGDKEDVTEEKESGSNQQRDQVDHDYEADTRADVSMESGSSVEGRHTTTSKSGSSSSTSVTTEKESSPGTSLRLVSLSNLVPNSPPPPSEPKRNPTPSWTVAEVAQNNLILFSYFVSHPGLPPRPRT